MIETCSVHRHHKISIWQISGRPIEKEEEEEQARPAPTMTNCLESHPGFHLRLKEVDQLLEGPPPE